MCAVLPGMRRQTFSIGFKALIKYLFMSHPVDHSFVKVFFALWPTAAERSQLAEWQIPLQHLCGGRTMRGETLHNTLVFVGGIEQSRLAALQLAALEVSAACFEVCFDEACYWSHNHIVYAAPSHVPQKLAQLASALEHLLTVHRFKFEPRDYKPHVTLLRNARWADLPLPEMLPVCWQINDFALVQSMRNGGLAGYRSLARFALSKSGLTSGMPSSG